MDTTTAEAYAKAYALTVDDVLLWWEELPANVQPIMAKAFKDSHAPYHDVEAHKLFEQGLISWGDFVAERQRAGLAELQAEWEAEFV